ncbi:hypothetical protein [Lentilactobacillus kosonis]|uniref:Uncharacterized protein n=1 Tax=Lentilactobacillus kosonis TaxID=2810561 RepID=A0A401FPN9_9LACO|nr:hypothetical protein [Lentilactobacillus kosonis]GAY74276.1 hypothetical protein NBRC111893_2422 [Lentilactobacillus kosonis]
MALKIVMVKAKQDDNGNYIAPNRYTAKPEDIVDSGEASVQISGYKSGDVIPDGAYYVGFYNDQLEKFLGTFQKVAGFTVQ